MAHPISDMAHHNPAGFTVVIPAYNPGGMLREALESIAEQRRKADWVVVIDDGSTDGTFEAANRWIAEFALPGIVLRQPNQGISVARNAGLAARRSDRIALLDADDLWLPNHLENLHRAYERDPLAVVAFGDSRFFGDARSRTDRLAQKISLGLSEADLGAQIHRLSPAVFETLLPGQFIPVSAVSFRMDLDGAEPHFDVALKAGLGEDRYFLLHMARRGPFVFCDEQSCRTRRHDTNTTHSGKLTWLARNALVLLDKIRSDPQLALTSSEQRIVQDTEKRLADQLLYESSQFGLKSYLEGRRFVSAKVPRALVWSIRDLVRAVAITSGVIRTSSR